MLITCPHCGARATIRNSRAISKLTREAYCQCSNLACGHTFRASLEVVETLSPSAIPDPDVMAHLPVSPHVRSPQPEGVLPPGKSAIHL